MYRLSLQDVAQISGETFMRVRDAAQRGGSVANIDFARYGERDQFGDVTHVRIPESLARGLKGEVTQHSDAQAIDLGRTIERNAQEGSGRQGQARSNAVDAGEPMPAVREDQTPAQAGDDGSGQEGQDAGSEASTAPSKGGVLGQALALTGLLGGIIFLQKMVEGSEPGQRRGGTRKQAPLGGRVQGPGVRSLST